MTKKHKSQTPIESIANEMATIIDLGILINISFPDLFKLYNLGVNDFAYRIGYGELSETNNINGMWDYIKDNEYLHSFWLL